MWRAEVVSPWRWARSPNQAGATGARIEGEGGGFFVSADETGGRRAYLKPTRRDVRPFYARAAREKIASDLAADLGVCVPPVMLYHRTDAPASEERFVCVSLVLFKIQWSWGVLRGYAEKPEESPEASEFVLSAIARGAAGALAFDAWVGQTDHADHPHNMIIGYEDHPDRAHLVSLDFAMAMGWGGSWKEGRWKHVLDTPFPPAMRRHVDRDMLIRKIEDIESFDEETIKEVVRRIPTEYIHDDDRVAIAEGLVGRKSLMRRSLNAYLEG